MRILPPFVLFMLLYTFLPLSWGAMTWEQSMKDLRMLLFNFPSMGGHLWFMYPLISLYIIMPVVSPWLQNSQAKDERLFLLFFGLSTFMPWLHRFVSPEIWGECFWNGFSMLWYCSGIGALYSFPHTLGHGEKGKNRCPLLGRRCVLYRLELLGEG